MSGPLYQALKIQSWLFFWQQWKEKGWKVQCPVTNYFQSSSCSQHLCQGQKQLERVIHDAAHTSSFFLTFFPSCISVPSIMQSTIPWRASFCGHSAICKKPVKKGLGLKETCALWSWLLVSASLLGPGFQHQLSTSLLCGLEQISSLPPPAQTFLFYKTWANCGAKWKHRAKIIEGAQ